MLTFTGRAQDIPPDRSTNWGDAGPRTAAPRPDRSISITDCGASVDGGFPADLAISEALSRLGGKPGIITFPPGDYHFTRGITLGDSVILRGAGAGHTRLRFDLGGRAEDAITIGRGGFVRPDIPLLPAERNARSVVVHASHALRADDWAVIGIDDADLMTSDWARGHVRQIVRITAVRGDTLDLASPLRMDLPTERTPRIAPMRVTRGAAIECLSLERVDATTAQTNLVTVTNAVDCRVIGIAGIRSDFGHVVVQHSSNILVRGGSFREAHAYGGGGQGYGVVLQYGAGECLVDNNSFAQLRHSILLQAGANGNVIAYNHSTDPYWTQALVPANTAGDIVLHGNWPFRNLFEGNVCQNITIDASHGRNGPDNTFFRNRAELYGVIMSSSPASDAQIFVGNDVTNTGFLLGNWILTGTGHHLRGNRVRGALQPAASAAPEQGSLYRTTPPSYWIGTGDWPSIGAPAAYGSGSNPARDRAGVAPRTDCGSDEVATAVHTPPAASIITVQAHPNPAHAFVLLHVNGVPRADRRLRVHTLTGALVRATRSDAAGSVDLRGLAAGTYLLVLDDPTAAPVRITVLP